MCSAEAAAVGVSEPAARSPEGGPGTQGGTCSGELPAHIQIPAWLKWEEWDVIYVIVMWRGIWRNPFFFFFLTFIWIHKVSVMCKHRGHSQSLHNQWQATTSCFRSGSSWVRSRSGLGESRMARLRLNPVRSGCEAGHPSLPCLKVPHSHWNSSAVVHLFFLIM